MSNFAPTRASLLQKNSQFADIPTSSFDVKENVKILQGERRELNAGKYIYISTTCRILVCAVISFLFFPTYSTERKKLEDRLSEVRSKILITQEEKDKKRQEQFEELEQEIDSISGGILTAAVSPSSDTLKGGYNPGRYFIFIDTRSHILVHYIDIFACIDLP